MAARCRWGTLSRSMAQLDVSVAGTRPEQIDQARTNLAAAQASFANAEATFERRNGLSATNASTKQMLDDAVRLRRADREHAASRRTCQPHRRGELTLGVALATDCDRGG